MKKKKYSAMEKKVFYAQNTRRMLENIATGVWLDMECKLPRIRNRISSVSPSKLAYHFTDYRYNKNTGRELEIDSVLFKNASLILHSCNTDRSVIEEEVNSLLGIVNMECGFFLLKRLLERTTREGWLNLLNNGIKPVGISNRMKIFPLVSHSDNSHSKSIEIEVIRGYEPSLDKWRRIKKLIRKWGLLSKDIHHKVTPAQRRIDNKLKETRE